MTKGEAEFIRKGLQTISTAIEKLFGKASAILVRLSERLDVNLVVGQTGVDGNSGNVSAKTLRTVLATNVALPAGTNNIGDVDVLTQPVRSANNDSITARIETDFIQSSGATALSVKRVVISAANNGDNTLVAALATNKIRVIAAVLIAAAAVDARFESAAAGTALTGVMSLDAKVPLVLPYNPNGWFQTAVNELLNLELSAGVQVSGVLTYIEPA